MKHASQILIFLLVVAIALPSRSQDLTLEVESEVPPGSLNASSFSMMSRHPRDADYPFTATLGPVTAYAASQSGWELIESALARFDNAGLELPDLALWVHDTRHGCSRSPGDLERSGVLLRSGSSISIHSCGTEFTLLHELAHAHDIGFLTDAIRAEFMKVREATAWSGVEWRFAGGEHAADVIAWALLEGAVRPSRTLPNDDASLASAYTILAGEAPDELELR